MNDFIVPVLVGIAGGLFVAVRIAKLMTGNRYPRFRDEPTRVKIVVIGLPIFMPILIVAAILISEAGTP